MSWLLAVLIPVLLMVATFGLERLEAGLDVGEDDADPITDLMLQTAPPAVRAQRPPTADPHLAHSADRMPSAAVPNRWAIFADEPGLPTRLCHRDLGNPQFQPTRHANPV